MGPRVIPFNRKATRWLSAWIDARFGFQEHSASPIHSHQAWSSTIAARRLQEAIVSSTLLCGAEIAWKRQRGHEERTQRILNPIARVTLGALPSVPIAFHEAVGGSMPASARLDQGQQAFADRLCSLWYPSTRQIMAGPAPQATRLRETLGLTERTSTHLQHREEAPPCMAHGTRLGRGSLQTGGQARGL